MASSTAATGASTIDGKQVNVVLEQGQDGVKKLSFRDGSDGIARLTIDHKAVIGIDRDERSSSFDLIYLAFDTDDGKPDLQHARLDCIKIEEASDALFAELQFVKSKESDNESYLQRVAHNGTTSIPLQVIVSVGSGTGQAERFEKEVLSPLLRWLLKHVQLDVLTTTSDQSIIELSRNKILPAAQKGEEQAIVLLSGDGGVIDILNVLYEQPHSQHYRPPNIAILPLGTGNALANSSSRYDDHTFGLRSLVNGDLRSLPTFQASFSAGAHQVTNEGQDETDLPTVKGVPTAYGAVVCSWGLHATLVADSDTVEYRKHGAARFQMAGKEALFPSDGSQPHPYQGSVSIIPADQSRSQHKGTRSSHEWETVGEHEHAYVLATLVSQLEAGFTINPSPTPLDGILRLIRFGPLPGNEAMDIMTKAYQGGVHIKDERVLYQAIEGLRIEFDEEDPRWRRVCIDGKIIRVEKNGWVKVTTNTESAVNLIATY